MKELNGLPLPFFWPIGWTIFYSFLNVKLCNILMELFKEPRAARNLTRVALMKISLLSNHANLLSQPVPCKLMCAQSSCTGCGVVRQDWAHTQARYFVPWTCSSPFSGSVAETECCNPSETRGAKLHGQKGKRQEEPESSERQRIWRAG